MAKFSIYSNKIKETKYNNKKVVSQIKVINVLYLKQERGRLRSERSIEKIKVGLFLMMKKIIIKNINNYVKLSMNSSVRDKCMSPMEMESEAYIVFENCLKNFNTDANYDFYFYFNKAMSRNFYRMFNREVRQREVGHIYHDEKHFTKTQSQFTDTDDDSELNILISSLNLSVDEEKVLYSKLHYQSKEQFLKENKKFTNAMYFNVMKKIKTIILNLKENGEL